MKNATIDEKNKLKRYRGLLLSECVDVIDEHEHLKSQQHQIGDLKTTCGLCKRYIELQSTIANVAEMIGHIEVAEQRVSTSQSATLNYFQCQHLDQSVYIVRTTSAQKVATIIGKTLDPSEWITIQITAKRAFRLIELLDGSHGTQKISFLKGNQKFEGIISSLES